jgi:beta-carotene hydroxylase
MNNDITQFRLLVAPPSTAWPTMLLFLLAYVLYAVDLCIAQSDWAPFWLPIPGNTIASYWLFTVFHEASHGCLSQNKTVNDCMGRLSILSFPFLAYRWVHSLHHRFTNETLDPDSWLHKQPCCLLPVRWATLDIWYYIFYLPKFFVTIQGSVRAAARMHA